MTVDIGMCGSDQLTYLEPVVYRLVRGGVLGSYRMSTDGFNMRSIGLDSRADCSE